MVLDNRIGRREPEAVAFRLGREVRIEDAFEAILRDADAFIANRDPNVIARKQVGDRRSGVWTVGEIIAAHPQRSAIRHGLIGVHDQIRDHLADLARIDFRRPEIGAEQELASAVRAAQREADGVLDEFPDRGGLLNRRAAAGEGQELLGQIAGAQARRFSRRSAVSPSRRPAGGGGRRARCFR